MFLSAIKLFISSKQFINVIMVDGNISVLIKEKANNSQPCSINKADMFFLYLRMSHLVLILPLQKLQPQHVTCFHFAAMKMKTTGYINK